MIAPAYRSQVELLLRVMPCVAKEQIFALKGGTAINLFLRDMPRLSVDIDLTYLPFDGRDAALANIDAALNRLRTSLNKSVPGIKVSAPSREGLDAKLTCRLPGALVKIEVNTIIRGHLWPVRELQLSQSAQNEFGMFATATVVSDAELFGGKICAALDRQHPRDLFDVHQLLTHQSLSEEIRLGFLASVLSHPRPIHELIRPGFQDQRQVFDTQFAGMAIHPFTYDEYEATRVELVGQIHATMTADDRRFLISFKEGAPEWGLFPVAGIERLPAVQWKLSNIQTLRKNATKHAEQLAALKDALTE
jgi:predicted nucleotidyltransferase component of viral defense system